MKVECDAGYSQLGSSVITCTKEKTWKNAGGLPGCLAGRFAALRSFPMTVFCPKGLHFKWILPQADVGQRVFCHFVCQHVVIQPFCW